LFDHHQNKGFGTDMKSWTLSRGKNFNQVVGDIFSYTSRKAMTDFYCLFQYTHFLNLLRQEKELNFGLEIGTGFSTYLTGLLVKEKNFKMYSVDMNLEKLYKIGGRRGYKLLSEYVELIKGLTITNEEFDGFYNKSMSEYGGLKICDIHAAVASFVVPYKGNYANLSGKISGGKFAEPFFTNSNSMNFRKELVDINGSFDKTREFLTNNVSYHAAFSKIVKETEYFDFIFFDCSEHSSIIEWINLNQKIRVGGYAILHDIYFPKSIKNFIPCAYVLAHPDWSILYQDKTTVQGMIVAKRMR